MGYGNLILKAAEKPVSAGMFWRMLLGAIANLAFGYAGETGVLEARIGSSLAWAAGSASSRRRRRAAVHYRYMRKYLVQVHE